MAKTSRVITLRIDNDTLARLELAASENAPLTLNRRGQARYPDYNRSAMIRHAICTGLDFLTHQPPLEL